MYEHLFVLSQGSPDTCDLPICCRDDSPGSVSHPHTQGHYMYTYHLQLCKMSLIAAQKYIMPHLQAVVLYFEDFCKCKSHIPYDNMFNVIISRPHIHWYIEEPR